MNGQILELVNVTRDAAWLPWAVQYFFLIGLSVGAFLLTLPAFMMRKQGCVAMARLALLVAVTTGLAAPVALLADLHQPFRFWHFYAYTNTGSWMGLGSLFLPAYVGLLVIYAWAVHRPQLAERGREDGRFAGLYRLAALGGEGNGLVPVLAGLTAVAAAAVIVYTGMELMVLKARPLWNTPLLPVQLLVTAVVGAIGVVLVLNRAMGFDPVLERRMNTMLAMALTLVAVLGLVWFAVGASSLEPVHAAALASVADAPQWQFTAMWAAVATLVPLALAWRMPLGSGWITGLIAIHNAWMFRWTVFMGGQSVPKTGAGLYEYVLPMGPEGLLGIVGTFGLWLFLVVTLTTVLPWRSCGVPGLHGTVAARLEAKEN